MPMMLMMMIIGHKDSVVQVSWSHDGTMLASGDMAGLIQVWSVATKELIWSFEISDLEVRYLTFGSNHWYYI